MDASRLESETGENQSRINTSAVDLTPMQMLRQPSFYVIYLMMTMLAFGGLVVPHSSTHGRLVSRR